jgi:hypothetical protein
MFDSQSVLREKRHGSAALQNATAGLTRTGRLRLGLRRCSAAFICVEN